MEKRWRVAVYGNSLHMAGIVTCLKAEKTLEVFCINPVTPGALQILEEKDFAAIIFDPSDPPMLMDVTLLRDRPGLLLIGVDSSRNELLVLSSRPTQALSMADLIGVIHTKEAPSNT